jgi:hypothetical protein
LASSTANKNANKRIGSAHNMKYIKSFMVKQMH